MTSHVFSDDEVLAREVIGWGERIEHRMIALDENDLRHGTRRLRDTGKNAGFLSVFDTSVAARVLPYLPDDDREAAVVSFFSRYPRLTSWYQALLDTCGMRFEFSEGTPNADLHNLKDVRRLAQSVDPDALALFDLVRQGPWWQAAELDRWGEHIPVGDKEFRRMMERGLAEVHVHFEGCHSVPGAWMSMLFGSLHMDSVPPFSKGHLNRLAKAREGWAGPSRGQMTELAEAERKALARGIEAGRELCHRFDRARFKDDGEARRLHIVRKLKFPTSAQEKDKARSLPATAWRGDALKFERCALAWAWNIAISNPVDTSGLETIHLLDSYLHAKNLFRSRILQMPGAAPGLTRFKKHFKFHKIQAVPVKSISVRKLSLTTLFENVADNPFLKQVELRISPMDSVQEYREFFKTWKILGQDLLEGASANENLKRLAELHKHCRFIVHFIREPDTSLETPPFHSLRRRLGNQSAILHFFRSAHPDIARLIVGLDVANLERECPPDIFTPYLKLLRRPELANPESFNPDEIGFSRAESVYVEKWKRMKNRKFGMIATNKLGLTYHAGEDFFNPVDGMRQMDEAIIFGEMKAGDRIGHGLAAGVDWSKFVHSSRANAAMPRGAILDSLVWLYRRAAGKAPFAELHRMENQRDSLCMEIYGQKLEWEILHEVVRERHCLVPGRSKPDGTQRAKLLRHQELYDARTARLRAEWVPQKAYFSEIDETCGIVQSEFVSEIDQRRIVLEYNPSSNHGILNLTSLVEHPYFHKKNILGERPRATFNTDDPGVFFTRQDIEFGLMLNAMLQTGMETKEALAELEAIRLNGFSDSFHAMSPGAI